MKYILILLLICTCVSFAQYDPNAKEYEITFKQCNTSQYDPVLPDSMYFAEGDTLKIFFGFNSAGGPTDWQPSLAEISVRFDNSPALWRNNLAETHFPAVDLSSGKWQVRVRAHGYNGEVTPYSERVDIGITGFPKAIKMLIIK